MADPGWQAAMRRRGYDPSAADVFCAPLAAGYSGDPAEMGRRLLRVTCFDKTGATNLWARPIEGLLATIDLDSDKIVQLVDTGAVPLSPNPGRFEGTPQVAPKPAANRAPPAPRFAVDGNTVRWNKWSFHYRMDPRSGLVLSLLRYDDQGRQRMVLYRGSLAELYVAYMDPSPNWSFRTFMDAGEYGLGPLSLPLTSGSDCPSDAIFLNATLADEHGEPVERRNVICLFERDTAAPLWRHAEIADGTYEGRPAVELVMRSIPSLGNYDYVIDWVLTETGAIRIDVGATGIDQVKGVRARSPADPSAAHDAAYGSLIAPGLVAVNHDHFLSFRLDVDIDGEANTLVRQRLVRQRPNAGPERQALWRVVEDGVGVEGPLDALPHGGDGTWRIVNPNRTNPLGKHPSYELRAGHSASPLIGADTAATGRAGFAAAPLWVTAYDRNELYAAGPYPNQSRGGDGLPAYAARRRQVRNADIVLWCTMGFHHIPRPEDWPVLPTMWHSLALVPDGFFGGNPAIAVAPQSSLPAAAK
jgi:primary-amine oxidase